MSNYYSDFTRQIDNARPVQIVSPADHAFQLELEQLENILLKDEIRDRYVVVVSIAGAYRKGKSFLMNFLLKYLNAQYKKYDASNWIGEFGNINNTPGFKSRGGSEPETTGIWMWSDIFTYDFENGEKIAIILLDTQGIFDQSSSVKECTTIFALSMLLSSVQCFNVMQNIQDDDLQYLNLFANYGQLANAQGATDTKSFQKLLFIVRDWPYSHETGYGWNGKRKIDEILAGNVKLTPEKQQLRQGITSSFEEISGFFFPYPGNIIAQGNSFTGDIRQIDPEFIECMKEFVPAILAPENLCVKKINDQKVRVRDLLQYFQQYTNIFSGNDLPVPKTILMATAEANNLILHNSCLNHYNNSMQISLEKIEPCFTEKNLSNLHQQIMAEAVEQFNEKPKLGSYELALSFQRKLESDMEERFVFFKRENDMKRKSFIEKANLHNEKILKDIKATSGKRMSREIANDMNLTLSTARSSLERIRSLALEQFDADKMGNDEYSDSYRNKLKRDMDSMEYMLLKTWESHDKCLRKYGALMQESLERVASYFSESELMDLHRTSKNGTLSQFLEKIGTIDDDELAYSFEHRIERKFEAELKHFERQNKKKQQLYNDAATLHNKSLNKQIISVFIDKMRTGIGKSCLEEHRFTALFLEHKLDALKVFDLNKKSDNEICMSLRRDLEQDIDELREGFLQFNESNRSNLLTYLGGFTGGASCGASIGKFFGPEGIIAGTVIGGTAGIAVGVVTVLIRKTVRAKRV